MTTTDPLSDRVHGAVIGHAVGDALGAPTEGMSLRGIRETYGWVADFLVDDPAGTDDTEYAALTAQLVIAHGAELTAAAVAAEWRRVLVAQAGGFAGGGFSEMESIRNLSRGVEPPASGSDNHELWSDGSAMRAAPIGAAFPGDPDEAARVARIEASVSHARDGVWCGGAIAAAVAKAVVSDDWHEVADAGRAALPDDCWSARMVDRAMDVANAAGDRMERLERLEREVSLPHYPWADVAPEATALAFGVFAIAEGEYVDAVLNGVNIGRDADTIAAMAGAMAGGLRGISAVPVSWRDRVGTLRGSCIQAMAGVRLADLADALVARAGAAAPR